ncbi:hypothetical protein JCM8547_008709 [Rhodosporidiobolus lusitaniae]
MAPSHTFNPDAVAASESLRLLSFSSAEAFELGCAVRDKILADFVPKGEQAVVAVTAASGQQLFFASAGEGTQLEHGNWARRKHSAVLRWGKSSAALFLLWPEGIPSMFGVDTKDYAAAGGGVPLRVKGVEGIVGTVCVSGLAQEDDHQIIVDCVEEFIKKQEAK